MTEPFQPPVGTGQVDDLNRLLEMIPYAQFLGLSGELVEGRVILVMPADDRLVGNPLLPALHGGTVGALLESAAIVGAMWQAKLTQVPKTITITVDYLRSGRVQTTRARVSVTKQGRRVLSVAVDAFQADPDRPIASAHAHLLLARHGGPGDP